VNLEYPVAEEETYSDHCEKDADGAKSGLSWCDVRDLLRKIHDVDGHIQRGESSLPILGLGFGCHRRSARWWWGSGAERKNPSPNRDGRPFCHDTPRAHRPNLMKSVASAAKLQRDRLITQVLSFSRFKGTSNPPYWLLCQRRSFETPIHHAISPREMESLARVSSTRLKGAERTLTKHGTTMCTNRDRRYHQWRHTPTTSRRFHNFFLRYASCWNVGSSSSSAATTATLPVDLTVQFCPASATKSDPLQISRIEQEARCVHASILFTPNGFSPINRRP